MTKEQRLAKYLLEHPEEPSVKQAIYKFEKKELYMKRASEMFEALKRLKSLELVGKEFGMTRERARQILTKAYGDEYKSTKIENHNFKKAETKKKQVKENTCLHCKNIFTTNIRIGKYCSRKCMAVSKKINTYPDWVGDRALEKENFTIAEWRIINNIRTKGYYHRHQKMMSERQRLYQRKNSVKQNIYQKRARERKKYGHAITPLKKPTNLAAIKP